MSTSTGTVKAAPIHQPSNQPEGVDCCWRRPTTAAEPTPKARTQRPLPAEGSESGSTDYRSSNSMCRSHASLHSMLTASKRPASTSYDRDGTGSKRRRGHGPDSPGIIVFEEYPVYNKASNTTSASCAAGTTYNPMSEHPREIQRSKPAKGCADGLAHNASGSRPQQQGAQDQQPGLRHTGPGQNGKACNQHGSVVISADTGSPTTSATGISSISTCVSADVVAKGAEEAMPGSPTTSLDTSCSSPGQINGKQQQLQCQQAVHVAHMGIAEINQPQQTELQAGAAAQQAGAAAQQGGRHWRYRKLGCGAVVHLVLLLKLVRRLGGCQQVTRCHGWSVLARALGLPAHSGMLLMHLYASQLLHLDAGAARVPLQ